jgi:16S rRNA (adenine1518-N6/adenine1519-N6)-dimethyltransferase
VRRRKLGQHFLTDKKIIQRILHTAQITSQDRVLEIGPGNGCLTGSLARQAKQLIAVEYDVELASNLQQAFVEYRNVQILQADARDLDYGDLFSDCDIQESGVKVVANLPYYAAVPILFSLFHYVHVFSECTLMFQKEVAERITASPGNKSYGALSVAVQYYSEPAYCFLIPPQAFRPRPQIDSAVVQLHFLKQPRIAVLDQEHFFQLIKCSFRSRRKTLKNSLAKNCAKGFSKHLLHIAYEQLHFPENIRGEELSLEDFANLSNSLITMQRSQNT